jgi:dethiobiotin synthetase
MCKGFFVTGTDTGIGKTVLSSLLCTALRAIYWKPIQTGAEEGTDREAVISWAGIETKQTLPEAYLFNDPVSPHLAAQRVGCEIFLETIKLPDENSPTSLIVEGAGGVMVPINSHQFMTDLMQHVGLPVILAARSTLGTINHTLLSLGSLRAAGVRVRGVVLIGPMNPENKEAIEYYGKIQVVGQIPPLTEINQRALHDVFARYFNRKAFA